MHSDFDLHEHMECIGVTWVSAETLFEKPLGFLLGEGGVGLDGGGVEAHEEKGSGSNDDASGFNNKRRMRLGFGGEGRWRGCFLRRETRGRFRRKF